MPAPAEMEVRTVAGREVKVRWKSPRFKEWLAWCYLPADNGIHQDGVGFEARAGSPDEAKAALIAQVERHFAGAASPADS